MLVILEILFMALVGLIVGYGISLVARAKGSDRWVIGGIFAGIFVAIVMPITNTIIGWQVDYWLYQSMELGQVWLTRFWYQWGLFGAGLVISTFVIALNVFIAGAAIPTKLPTGQKWLVILGCVVVGIGFGLASKGNWDEILLFLNQVPAGVTDPLFGVDVSWYLFTYPFYSRMLGWGFFLLIVTGIATASVYLLQAQLTNSTKVKEETNASLIRHLGILAALFFVLVAGYWLLRQMALPLNGWSGSGYAGEMINGAAYVDIHYTNSALGMMPWLSLVIALACLVAGFRRNGSWLVGAISVKAAFFVIALMIIPWLTWTFSVRPDEYNKESDYIVWDNKGSLAAYGVSDNFREEDFPVEPLSADDVATAPDGIFDNIRLMDPFEVFLPNAQQDQEIRTYYSFLDADIALYQYENGDVVQVMSSGREMCQDEIPTQTWVNEHLVFTHGQGLTMAGVHDFDTEGNMGYLVTGIPSQGPFTVPQEAIYYGECSEQFIVTGTSVKEVGPPDPAGGWKEVEYDGEGGVLLGSGWKRLAFAITFNDFTLLISDKVDASSRVHFQRNIQERMSDLLPFAWLDSDPYLVAPEGSEHLVWIWDAAVTAENYPYADTVSIGDGLFTDHIRYLRPSIKVTLDAYTGIPGIYLVDPTDPVATTWSKIFPNLFQSGSKLPEDLSFYIRYPEQVFIKQAEILERHHMVNPLQLYNGEDLWVIASEQIGEEVTQTAPRYVFTTLPGESRPEYVLDWSYTRHDKPNGVGLLVARSSLENYGELVLYKYPVGESVTGPAQFESLINQDPELGAQLTLLGQQGKRIVRGNLMTLPVGDTLLYVKPIYVGSTTQGGTSLPQLRFVVVGSSDRRIKFGRTLNEALAKLSQEGVITENDVEEVSVPFEPTFPISGTVPITGTNTTNTCDVLWLQLQTAAANRNREDAARISTELALNCP
ncbi:UPF0182 family protein [candidate division WWE3 bacterium]|uniref:UPF0182 family protein n=1 Tax=candidate division WWE3 bacterium TaxID=2053526 RepID=A0A955LGU1_UNCKA|nr:UPF0182 family protein [candidate division WWE3 bacterium]